MIDATDEGTYGYRSGSGESLIDIDLRKIIAAVRRSMKWVLAIIAVAIVAGIVVTLLITPRYVAVSQVLVEQQTDQIIEGSDLQQNNSDGDTELFLQTQVDVLRSRSLAQRVAESNKFIDDANFYAVMDSKMPEVGDLEPGKIGQENLESLRLDTAIELLQDNLNIILPTDSRIIQIKVRSADPAIAAKIANGYAENFIESNLKRKFDSSAYAREFLSNQLAEARAGVERSERELNQYSRAAGLIRVTGQGQNADRETTLSVTNDSLVQLNQAASGAAADRTAAEENWNSIAREPVLSIPAVIQNSAIQDLLKQKAGIEARLAEERVRHLDDYPTVKVLIAQVNELNMRIETIGNSIKRSIYLEYVAAKEKEDSIYATVQSMRSTAMAEQDRGVQYNILKRVAETDRTLYDTLLARYNQLKASAGVTSNNITLVDRAEEPRSPSSPNLLLNLLLALVAGTGFAAVFVLMREYFDDTIRTPEDVESKLGLPLLGLIPVEEGGDTMEALGDPKSTLSEAYHSLVANLRYSTANGLPHTLVVTSAGESEGKSTTSWAIAADLARLGKRVLLIDTDLRRPTLHRRLATPNLPGLTDVLTGNRAFDDVLHPSEQQNLTCMTALPIPPDPSLLLGGERLAAVAREARGKFDVVIFDSPPLLGLSDTASIAMQSDGVLFMVDASQFMRGASKAALRRLSLVNATVLGVVLTKFDPRTAGGDYSYYGYSYYSYGDRDPANA